ncbi:MAG: hypothetical protein ACODAE_02685 [Gemmatimonadota bacterium]
MDAATPDVAELPGTWTIRATGARIVGGYGHNFAYDGRNVRPLRGQAEATVNTVDGTGRVVVEIETTDRSGPIRFSEDRSFEGRIRIVQRLNTERMDAARIMESVRLHGDTGNEAPVMPEIYNYFATWGPASISVNGQEVVPMIGSHTMFSEQARGADGRIEKDGQIYSPMVENKQGFTNPEETEFHFVAHTTEPDEDNFPPHTAWIHLHFSDVEVVEQPSDATVPYTQAAGGE